MKDRIFKNWTIIRVVYLSMGLFLLTSSIQHHEWLGVLFGSYVASMGLFALGCAGGQCAGEQCYTNNHLPAKDLDSVEYEEVK